MKHSKKNLTEKQNKILNTIQIIKSDWRSILIVILCAFFYAFGQIQFLLKSASMSDGVEAISTTISYIFPQVKSFLTVFYLLLNIPFLIFFRKKIKKDFLFLTIIFLIFNALFGFVLGIKEIDDYISNKIIVFIPDGNVFDPINKKTNIVNQGWPVFIYASLAVVFCSPASAFIWKNGASTGGAEIIAHYISIKKKKDIGIFLLIIGSLMAGIGIIIVIILKIFAVDNIKNNINGFSKIINVQVISSFIYIFANAFIINLLFPKYKKVKIKIDIKEYTKIYYLFEKLNYWHSYKIKPSKSGYTKQEIHTVETIVLLLEAEFIVKEIKKIDPNIWISIIPVNKIVGNFNYSLIE